MFDKSIDQLDVNVMILRSTISKYENELKTLKARASVSVATKKLNKSMSNIDAQTITLKGEVGVYEKIGER